MMKHKVSYITSHYGSFAHLQRCINSVSNDCNQSGVEYEHLIWIDGHISNLSSEEEAKLRSI